MTTTTEAIIFSMASRITEQYPDISVSQAMSLATIANDEFNQHQLQPQTTRKSNKKTTDPNKPKRTKNAFMFYLDSVRSEIKSQLLQKAQESDPTVTSIKVSEVTSAAGAKWRELSEEDKEPFRKAAEDLKTQATQSAQATQDTPAASTKTPQASTQDQITPFQAATPPTPPS